MRKTIYRRLFSFIFVLFLSFSILVPTAAADESATAPEAGSGGGSNVPFSLVESKPSDGEADIDTDTTIWLLFNKNVVNMTIAENNKENITLKDSAGNPVKAEVTMKDDQVEPEFRREIVVVPGESLEEGTKYILTVGKSVLAKNGQSLEKDYAVAFTTKGKTEATAVTPSAASAALITESSPATTSSVTSPSVTVSSVDTATDSSVTEGGETLNKEKLAVGIIGLAVVIIGLAVLVIYFIRRKNRR